MVKLSNVISLDGRPTYIKALEDHIAQLSDEQKNVRVSDMILISSVEDSSLFTIIVGDNIMYLVGLIEMIKIHLVATSTGEI